MPPVHPAIVHYPIALVTLSVVADLFGFIFGSQSLQHAGWWALMEIPTISVFRFIS